jgi:hypothetical protein
MSLAVKRFTTSNERTSENLRASRVCEPARLRDDTHRHRGTTLLRLTALAALAPAFLGERFPAA